MSDENERDRELEILIGELVNGWTAFLSTRKSEDRASAANAMDAVCRRAWEAIGRSLDETVTVCDHNFRRAGHGEPSICTKCKEREWMP